MKTTSHLLEGMTLKLQPDFEHEIFVIEPLLNVSSVSLQTDKPAELHSRDLHHELEEKERNSRERKD